MQDAFGMQGAFCMQDAFGLTSSLAQGQTDLPSLWLHPVHARGNGPCPHGLGTSSRILTNIQDLVGVAVAAVQEFSAPFGSQERRWRNEYRISFSRSGLIINSSGDGDAESYWPIPLRFSEVTHFQTQAGTLFLLIGLRKISKQPSIEQFNSPFEEYWVVGVTSIDKGSPQPEATLPKLLTAMGVLGAVRSDLHESHDIAHEAIGTGGCASVHLGRARTPALTRGKDIAKSEDTIVAVKIPTAESSHSIAKEAGFLMDSTRHQNIIGFLGLFKVPDLASDLNWRWAIMIQCCSGGDLGDLLQANGRCTEWRSAEITFGLLSGLSHLHSQRMVHRDVKPENILLMDQGRPVLADFGIAAYLDDAQAMTEKCGTPGHCAPEILQSKEYNAKVDIFSSGVVLYFIVSGALPFQGPSIASVLRRNARCKVRMDEEYFRIVSSKFKSLIKLFLMRDPEKRPTSAEALHEVILAYRTELRASSLLLDCSIYAAQPEDQKVSRVTCSDGTTMTFKSEARSKVSRLSTDGCFGRPFLSSARASEASSCSTNADLSRGRGTYCYSRGTSPPRGTSHMQASWDVSNASDSPCLPFCAESIATDALATGKMQGPVMNKRCEFSKEMRHRSKCLPVLDEGAGPYTEVERSGLPLSSQGGDVSEQRDVQYKSKRGFPVSCFDSGCNSLNAEDENPNNAAGLDHQVDGDGSTPRFGSGPHAPPPDTVMKSDRRLVLFRKRRYGITKYNQADTLVADGQVKKEFAADKQGVTTFSCGSEVTKAEMTAASESDRPSEPWCSTVSSCRPTGKSFIDDNGAHASFDYDVLEDWTLQDMPR